MKNNNKLLLLLLLKMKIYGVYSHDQFKIIDNLISDVNIQYKPYIYYRELKTNKIVLITQIFNDSNTKSNFDDAIYYGEVEFYGAFKMPQRFA